MCKVQHLHRGALCKRNTNPAADKTQVIKPEPLSSCSHDCSLLLTLGLKMHYLNLHTVDHVTSPLLPLQHLSHFGGLCRGRPPKTPTPRSLTPPAKHPIKGAAVAQTFMPANAGKRNGVGKGKLSIEHQQQHGLHQWWTAEVIQRETTTVSPTTKGTNGNTAEKYTLFRVLL